MSTSSPLRLLLVEDEATNASLLTESLEAEGFVVDWLRDGDGLIDRIRQQPPALLLLDLGLPGKDGLSLCRDIRQFSTLPIIMITARVEEVDRLLGLEIGADDYVCKPFLAREVVARVRALLRRVGIWKAEPVQLGWHFDAERMQVRFGSHLFVLTTVEFRLLKTLADRPGRLFSRAQLLDAIYADHRVVSDRTVDSHVKNLRRKVAETHPDLDPIESVYGVGYRFREA